MSEFGDPLNPFNEANVDAAYARACYSLPGCLGRLQVKYMTHHAAEVSVDESSLPGSALRTVEMDCHGPFSTDLNAFLNPYAEVYRRQDMIGWPINMEARIIMGDLLVNGAVERRWATLRRVDGQPFGVSGVSLIRAGELEAWNAVTINYGWRDDDVDVEFWGEDIDTAQPRSTKIDEADGRVFEAHIESMYRAMLRRLNKEVGVDAV